MDKLYEWEDLKSCEPYVVEEVIDHDGSMPWSIKHKGLCLFIPNDVCDIRPSVGEKVQLISHLGRDIGHPIRGITIGGRMYRVPPTEHEINFDLLGAL